MNRKLLAGCVFFSSITGILIVNAAEVEEKLNIKLFTGYNKAIRPVKEHNDSITVTLKNALYNIVEVDAAHQTVTLKLWFRMFWFDAFLTWNPKDFKDIENFNVMMDQIWIPDVVLLEQTSIWQLPSSQYSVIIRSDGYVRCSTDQLVTFFCPFDVANFPFDIQNCTMRYSSWVHSADRLEVFADKIAILDEYRESNEWTLRSYSVQNHRSTFSNVSYTDAYYFLEVGRKPYYYITTFFLTSYIITCLAVIGVFAPFNDSGERQEKVTMGLTAMLTMAVVLLIVVDQMPKFSNKMPLLGVFIMFEICLSAAATIISVGIIHLHSKWLENTPVPVLLLWITNMKPKARTKDFHAKHIEMKNVGPMPNAVASVTEGPPLPPLRSAKGGRGHYSFVESKHPLQLRWAKVTRRLDFILMFAFSGFNTLIFAIFMIIGSLKLN